MRFLCQDTNWHNKWVWLERFIITLFYESHCTTDPYSLSLLPLYTLHHNTMCWNPATKLVILNIFTLSTYTKSISCISSSQRQVSRLLKHFTAGILAACWYFHITLFMIQPTLCCLVLPTGGRHWQKNIPTHLFEQIDGWCIEVQLSRGVLNKFAIILGAKQASHVLVSRVLNFFARHWRRAK